MPQRRRVARAAVSGAATAALLTLATPAWASSPIPINPDHEGETAAEFKTQDCADERFDNLPAGYDGWHFVLPPGGQTPASFESLTLTFNNGTTNVTITVPDPDDAYPDALYPAGQNDDRVMHAYLFTPAGWTLVDGTAEVTGTASKFNLSHTCPGDSTPGTPTATPTTPGGTPTPTTPGETPTPTTPGETPTPTTPGESESPATPGESGTPSESTDGGGEDDGGLPLTGVAGTSIALTGLALIGGGVALTFLRRRRDNVTFTS